MSKAKERKRESERTPMWLSVMLDILRGSGIAAFAAFLVLLLGALLISSGLIADTRMNSTVIAACLLGTFCGGLTAVMRVRRMTLAVGAAVGSVFFVLLLTAGALIYGDGHSMQGFGPVLCACLCGGGLAGIVGSSPKKKRRR